MAGQQSEHEDLKVRFEASDVPPLLPLWLAAGLAGCVIIVFVGVTLGYPLANHQEQRGPIHAFPQPPRLQTAPRQDLLKYQQAKRRELKQIVPIEAAMQQTAAQGWGPPK